MKKIFYNILPSTMGEINKSRVVFIVAVCLMLLLNLLMYLVESWKDY